jgi:hypothetical protein
MKPKSLVWVTFVLSGFLCSLAHADMGMFDSLEWLVARGDEIGIYHAERIYPSDSVTNGSTISTGHYSIAEFKLQKTLRGSPPFAFSRDYLLPTYGTSGFKAGDTYIFFSVNKELRHDSLNENSFFSMWDYIWLERPLGVENGVAIDHNGNVLADKKAILKAVNASLKLPRAYPGIDRSSYFYPKDSAHYPDCTKFNFRVLDFNRMAGASIKNEPWLLETTSSMGLVIPESLYSPTAIDPDTTSALFDILKQIERQIPEVKLLGLNGGSPAAGPSDGVEYVLTGFCLRNNTRYHPAGDFPAAVGSVPYDDFMVKITRCVSSLSAQKTLEKIKRQRSAAPPSKEPYKGVTLYRYTADKSAVIFQEGICIVEISDISEAARALTTNVLNVVLTELDSFTSKQK